MQVLTQQKSTRATPATQKGGVALRRAAGGDVADGPDGGGADDALAGLRQALDASPGVQAQLRLQRALDVSPRATVQACAAERPALQRADPDDDDEMTAALDEATAQREVAAASDPPPAEAPSGPPQGNGLPAGLRSGIERLSGLAMDDVNVHYNSAKPAQLQALAYAQGSDIHVGPGQEKHLPHEAWHVVQQKQGRVQPTLQLQGTAVNDDASLEEEADRMGAQAALVTQREPAPLAAKTAAASGPVQAIMSVADFQNATPGAFLMPRSAVKTIDTALGNYIIASGAGKAAALNALIGVINVYLGGQHDPGRLNFVQNTLLPQANNELALIGALGAANGGLVPDLIVRIGGDANVPALTPVAQALTPVNAPLLPGLVTAAGGGANLVQLLAVAQAATAVNAPALEDLVTVAGAGNLAGLAQALAALTPANAFMMRGLIQAAGAANLGALANAIAAIQPANAGLVQGLVQAVGGGANLGGLTNVVTAVTPANAYLLQGLIPAAGGGANLAALVNLVNAITPGNAYLLQGLLPAAGGGANLVALTALVTAITPGNAYLLQGLIPAAGGGANLAALTNIVTAITPANALELAALIPLTGGAGALAGLLALVQAAGPGAAFALPNMVRDAGGAGQVANLTAAINHNHPGNGLLAVDLTRLTATNAVEFQRLTTALPRFQQAPTPGGMAPLGPLAAAVANYNGIGGLPANRQIAVTAANLQHFLSRHTYPYFDFGNVDDLNDQWPFVGVGTRINLEAQLAAALNAIAAGAPAPNWWVEPNRARQGLAVGAYSVTVGIRSLAGGPAPMQVGQFFPIQPGGGVEPFSGAQMRALHKLL